MRALPQFAILLALAAPLAAQQPVEPAEASLPREAVQFDGNTLSLAWENKSDVEQVKEYIPAEEKLDHWTILASIRECPSISEIKPLVGGMVKELKQKYPQSPMSLLENPQTGDALLDFVVWPPDGSFVEFNVFRYHKNPAGGVVAQQYAVRDYENPQQFLKQLRPLRQRLLNLMAKDGLTLSVQTADQESNE